MVRALPGVIFISKCRHTNGYRPKCLWTPLDRPSTIQSYEMGDSALSHENMTCFFSTSFKCCRLFFLQLKYTFQFV